MDVSFIGYGIVMLAFAGATGYHAIRRDIQSHREWATRLYAVGIGSAVYRLLIAPTIIVFIPDAAFKVWLNVATWVFYIPNLAVAELFVRGYCVGCCRSADST